MYIKLPLKGSQTIKHVYTPGFRLCHYALYTNRLTYNDIFNQKQSKSKQSKGSWYYVYLFLFTFSFQHVQVFPEVH
jgi:hypothetical protein